MIAKVWEWFLPPKLKRTEWYAAIYIAEAKAKRSRKQLRRIAEGRVST